MAGPHHWSETAANNGSADPNADLRPGRPANTVLGAIRGLMETVALARDDDLGALVAVLGANNVYSVTTNEGLIDPATQVNGLTPAITSRFLVRVVFGSPLVGSVANPPKIRFDGAVAVPLLHRDGTVPVDGDLSTIAPVLIQGDFAATGDTTITRARILDLTASDVAGMITPPSSARNRIFDPGFLVSQRVLPDALSYYPSTPNFSPALALASGVPAYPSDSCYGLRVGSVGGATVQRLAGPSISGGANWHRMTVTAQNGAPAATDLLAFVLFVEGVDIADLEWGTVNAKPLTLGLDTRFPNGTYTAAVLNAAPGSAARSNPVAFTVSGDGANGSLKTITFPGDQGGTWQAGKGVRGLSILITLCAGAGLVGNAGWQGGNACAVTGQANGMATSGATFDIAAPRLHVGSSLPAFDPPMFARALADAMRFYQTLTHFMAVSDLSGNTVVAILKFIVPMAKGPLASLTGPARLMWPGNSYPRQSSANISFDHSGDASDGGMAIMQAFSGLPSQTTMLGYFSDGQYIALDGSI